MGIKIDDLSIFAYDFRITDIVTGGKIRYPNIWGENFCSEKLKNIDRQLIGTDISYVESRSIQWQHRLTFINSKRERVVISLWYGQNGYTRKINIIYSTSSFFAEICYNICNQWEDLPVPMPHASRINATKLYQLVTSIADELDIQLINFKEKDWMDIFHFKTDGQAVVEFRYDSFMTYTVLHPLSSIGYDDDKLVSFCKYFEFNKCGHEERKNVIDLFDLLE